MRTRHGIARKSRNKHSYHWIIHIVFFFWTKYVLFPPKQYHKYQTTYRDKVNDVKMRHDEEEEGEEKPICRAKKTNNYILIVIFNGKMKMFGNECYV